MPDKVELVDGLNLFGAEWCTPCKMSKGLLTSKGVEFNAIDVEQETELAVANGIRNVPVVLIIQDGEVVDKHIGAISPANVQQWQDKGYV